MWSNEAICHVRVNAPDTLLAIDVTSSFGSVICPWEDADIWVCSVQKALGMPPGLGLMIVSPRAMAKAAELEGKGLNTPLAIKPFPNAKSIWTNGKHRRHQTLWPFTPWLKFWFFSKIIGKPKMKYVRPYGYIVGWIITRLLKTCVDYPHRSQTSISFTTKESNDINQLASAINELKSRYGISLGSGYGKWKNISWRIANFPVHTIEDFQQITSLLDTLL